VPKWCGKWVVSMDEFEDGVVGAKSKNLAGDYRAAVTVAVSVHISEEVATRSIATFRACVQGLLHASISFNYW
jgi:hypothetical protein